MGRSARAALWRSDGHAARYFDPLGVDPAILFADEGGDHGADVFGKPGPAEGRHIGDELVDLGVVSHDATAEVGLHGAGGDDVGSNTPRPQLLGEVLREYLDGALDGTVGAAAGKDDAGEP